MRRKRIKKSHPWRVVGGILFLCLTAAAGYFFLFSPFFQIEKIDIFSEIEVEGIIRKNLEGKKYGVEKKNIFLAPLEKIRADILSLSSEIESVEIKKKLPGSLEVAVKNYQDVGIWCQASRETATSTPEIKQCYDIDSKGVVYRESPIIRGNLILNISDFRGAEPKLKDIAVSPEMIGFILEVKKGIGVNSFEIINNTDLTAQTREGWLIYFNTSLSVKSQLEALDRVLKELVTETSSLEYIDLRIDGRVYYR